MLIKMETRIKKTKNSNDNHNKNNQGKLVTSLQLEKQTHEEDLPLTPNLEAQ